MSCRETVASQIWTQLCDRFGVEAPIGDQTRSCSRDDKITIGLDLIARPCEIPDADLIESTFESSRYRAAEL